jgi:tetratricopeptide (TPR) repeat protein
MSHHPRGMAARTLVLWAIALAIGIYCNPGSCEEPGAIAAPSADSAQPASWPRFALDQARHAAGTIDHPHRRSQALEQIAAATAGLGDCAAARVVLSDAIAAAREIADESLRDLAMRDSARRQAACGDVAGAFAALGEITSPEVRDSVALAVVSAQVEGGALPEALQVASGISDPVTMSDAKRAIALAHARRGQMSEARAIAERIPDFLVRALASADIAALHADIGNTQALNAARLIARHTPNARQRDVALGYVAGIQAQSGDVRGALDTAAAIRDGTSKAYALTRIANARTETADDAAVPELLERAFSTARRAKPTGATAAVLCEIAQSFVQRGDLAQARSALDHALTVALSKRGLRYSTPTVEKIARLRARTGNIPGALTIAEGIPDGSSRALLVHDILAAQAEAGDVAGAIKAANALSDVRLRVAGLFGIVGVQMTGGDTGGARASLRHVLELARETADPRFRSHSMAAVAAAQVELGDVEQAWPNFQDALAAAAGLTDGYTRAFAYVNVSDPFTRRP